MPFFRKTSSFLHDLIFYYYVLLSHFSFIELMLDLLCSFVNPFFVLFYHPVICNLCSLGIKFKFANKVQFNLENFICRIYREGGDIGLFITLVPRVLYERFLFVDIKPLGTVNKFWLVCSLIQMSKRFNQ